MRDTDLFQLALGMTPPWKVVDAKFDVEKKRLDISIDFSQGGTFGCPKCKASGLKAYDTEEKTWRHLSFFQHESYLTARVPRTKCEKCGVHRVDVPWARPGSGFTLLFEALIMTMAKAMPMKAIAAMVKENDTRLWRIIHHFVGKGKEVADYSNVKAVGADETSSRKGHDYVTVFVDLDDSRVLFATEGKDSATVEAFKEDLVSHGGAEGNIKNVCADMSPAFISGFRLQFPGAHLTFDKFHLVKLVNDAVDEVRRQEQKERPELLKTRYLWLKNPGNLKPYQRDRLETLKVSKLNLKTSRAYHIRLNFQEFFAQPVQDAGKFLQSWYYWATHSRLEPIVAAANTIKRHWEGVLQWSNSRISNGVLEGTNSLIQAAKARARGYRNKKYLIAMIYMLGGRLNYGLPT